MKAISLLIACFIGLSLNAQTLDTAKAYTPLPWPDCTPAYKGGDDAMLKFIHQNLKVPEVDGYNVQGTVYVQFTVDTLGKVQDAKAVREIPNCKYCTAEALRVVKLMEFVPCIKPVATQLVLPIKFTLR